MKKFMFRRPEYIEGVSKSRYMPGPVAAIGIGSLIFCAYFILGLIVSVIFLIAALRTSGIENIMGSVLSPAFIITMLGLEGTLVIFTFIHTRSIEKRPVTTLGFINRGFAKKLFAGFGIGAALLALTSLPAFLSTDITYTGFTPVAALYLLVFALVGAGEETLFRGYVFTALLRRMGVIWSVVISSAFFTLIHIFNGYGADGMLQVFLLGAVFSLLCLRTGSIWGAVGFHISWDFFVGLMSPIKINDIETGYSILNMSDSAGTDALSYILLYVLLLATIAIILFAGKGRLAVRTTRSRQMYEDARTLSRNACYGYTSLNKKPVFSLVRRVAEAAEGEDAKAAAFLKYALYFGAEPGSSNFDMDITDAARALLQGQAEDRENYERRVLENGIAARVLKAENEALDIMGAGYGLPGQTREDDMVQCPMLGWSIRRNGCRYFSGIVDAQVSGYNNSQEIPPYADREKCRHCPNRGI